MKSGKKILTVIGGGAMGSALVDGILGSGVWEACDIIVADVAQGVLESIAAMHRVRTTTDCAAAAAEADVLLIAVKPGVVLNVVTAIKDNIKNDCLVLSIAAGISTNRLETLFERDIAVIRAMPNTPCQIGCGAVAFSRGKLASDQDAKLALELFEAVGLALEVPESLMDAVTGLSGSGPAYIFLLIEALGDAGVDAGLTRDSALQLAAQTVMGAAKMVLETGRHPAVLKDQVTSPGGTTIAGIAELEKNGFRSAIFDAVRAAVKRSKELG